jgi:hypothetical protein
MRTEEERLASYRAAFLEKVKKWDWGRTDDSEYQGKPKGRKAKVKERPAAKPRTKSEQQVANKFFNYDTVNK